MGAAVLARMSCQSGMRRLQSSRSRSLYLANGLLLMGHGESVVMLRVTMRSNDSRFLGRRFVFGPKTVLSWSASMSDLNLVFQRNMRAAESNIALPLSM